MNELLHTENTLVGANGIFDALFNPNTVEADALLAMKMLVNPDGSTSFWGPLTFGFFYNISLLKLWFSGNLNSY